MPELSPRSWLCFMQLENSSLLLSTRCAIFAYVEKCSFPWHPEFWSPSVITFCYLRRSRKSMYHCFCIFSGTFFPCNSSFVFFPTWSQPRPKANLWPMQSRIPYVTIWLSWNFNHYRISSKCLTHVRVLSKRLDSHQTSLEGALPTWTGVRLFCWIP